MQYPTEIKLKTQFFFASLKKQKITGKKKQKLTLMSHMFYKYRITILFGISSYIKLVTLSCRAS